GRAEALGPIVRAEPAREEAVAVRVVNDVARARARASKRSRHQARPGVEILRGIAHDGGFPGRAARRMQPRELRARPREQAERVSLAQIVLHRERKPRYVLERADVARRDPGTLHAAPV